MKTRDAKKRKQRSILIRGKRYKLLWRRFKDQTVAECDHPEKKNKAIRLDPDQEGKELLDSVLHESLHAAFFDYEEAAISGVANDLTAILWDLGYRRTI